MTFLSARAGVGGVARYEQKYVSMATRLLTHPRLHHRKRSVVCELPLSWALSDLVLLHASISPPCSVVIQIMSDVRAGLPNDGYLDDHVDATYFRRLQINSSCWSGCSKKIQKSLY